ncbi:altronate dehydratase [Candidatus Poribacteria bacterium]|nr:altronate dehydratase [Candidatus Poribacteria bacterium]MYG08508.1 altronate dehydratase [Candidatus Poribacteria bacterium]MYK23059.1 altronate dehydratase [Candidatus Poribacteria bacterium]
MGYDFTTVARLPSPGDNVAITTQTLEGGTRIHYNGQQIQLSHTILEGHRFAIESISETSPLLSWGLPFGFAIRSIDPGDYVCNQKMIDSLSIRNLPFALPETPNFSDKMAPYQLDEAEFRPGTQMPRYTHARHFLGYQRPGNRGVGTRNYIVVMGTTSRTSGFARRLAEMCSVGGVWNPDIFPNIDGVVAVTHTEGGEDRTPNNVDMLLRTLAGFTVHPNIGAMLLVDYGTEAVTNEMLKAYMLREGYALDDVVHRFYRLQGSFDTDLVSGREIINGWLDTVNSVPRAEQPLENLKIALQCGGSDAFSGVSGNPLAAYVAKEVIRYGGCANLAETDELIGSEAYILQNVRDLATARTFLNTIERFKERVSWHGHSAEGNPSGGNNFRGLYNIAIKSIGAAMKRHPDVCLDYVINYSELMEESGYYFMDSPGNDLESIAGQVASGSNMIFFVTGNGSITNFPFVPTIKIVTTTGRYEMLSKDMDVNAGAYLDGTPMEELGESMLDLTVDVASGERSVGEKAGHSQVSLWRDWKQTGPVNLDLLLTESELKSGEPIPIGAVTETQRRVPTTLRPTAQRRVPTTLQFRALQTEAGYRTDQVGLILPTSLCSGQIAQMIAHHCNERGIGAKEGISRFVALPHTEGCGVSGGRSEEIYTRTMIGHLTHPKVALGLLLEHGCEKTHNDHVRHEIQKLGISPERYGWASVQLDGGIDAVIEKVQDWFSETLADKPPVPVVDAGLEHLCVAVTSTGEATEEVSQSLTQLTHGIVAVGGTVVVPANAAFVSHGTRGVPTTLAYGQRVEKAGFHVMETPTDQPTETLTGLGATGVDLALVHVVGAPLQSHVMVPLIQVSTDATTQANYGADLDLESANVDDLLALIVEVASRRYTPKLHGKGNTDFQLTRGLLGISM